MRKICLLFILNFFSVLSAQKPDLKSSIDSLLTNFQRHNAFSGNILLQKNGETIYKGEFNKFAEGSDQYRIGSITKVFTAIITFQLIEEGKLSLDSRLSKYFPSIKNAEMITIGNMLNHTSGIYNYLEWEDYYDQKSKNYTRDDMLKLLQQGKPDFKPGKESSYSNSNYLLLGYIIEDITGRSYEENIKARILDKIGMRRTYCEKDQTQYSKRTKSYKFDGENWSKESDTHPSFTFATGNIVSTTEDLSKLMHELFKGTLISENSLEQMKKTNPQVALGYGLFRTPFYNKTGYGHTGRIDEFHSGIAYFPEDNFSIVILANGTNIKLNDMVVGIVSKYYQKKYKNPDFTAYSSETAPSTEIYKGIYKAKLAGLITVGTFQITQAGKNHLFIAMYNHEKQGKESRKALLKRTGENEFYSFENGAELKFLLNEKGKVIGIKLTQGKQSINCKKV
ncbi:class A beta-lactamase-related serine hydrolase [Chryseobacterium carnipullorum]|uniref:Class A beta-lactamase-related serine hydrolase n=1 Tax=Chryseobacterium carnipullorum TaxID=1124835 RepID=A0A376DSZ4_CHRCU|nr:serine hydrolase domain-containing protein [Chryseobacterium carnipullorum]AZA49402.1 class A beta-lactamase-related serine hydrolase [Chryseobacterium carnipullorum]AZA64293.1 class A beta-lactamase-related serine hydrolase [Chryseobacterium carnipullorum]STC94263.1 D-alanyl-D-alanine carboxypeptidase precursor [Chryseobacterium carnipullorum]